MRPPQISDYAEAALWKENEERKRMAEQTASKYKDEEAKEKKKGGRGLFRTYKHSQSSYVSY